MSNTPSNAPVRWSSETAVAHLEAWALTHNIALVADCAYGEWTVVCPAENWQALAQYLRDELGVEMLIDAAGIDYLAYGQSEWLTEEATASGFSRASKRHAEADSVSDFLDVPEYPVGPEITDLAAFGFPARFAMVYQLLSIAHQYRLRIKVFCPGSPPAVDSVVPVWPSANWYEREAFDLFGIFFHGHPDLRRILTDYGFVGYPFRKDFPVSGHVEVRYDPNVQRVVYEPVSIEPRTLVPRVIREDNRYLDAEGEAGKS